MKQIIEKIISFFGSIPSDKLLHSYLAFIIFQVIYRIVAHFDVSNKINLTCSAMATFFILMAKEMYDENSETGHSTEIMDVVAGIGGIILGMILVIM